MKPPSVTVTANEYLDARRSEWVIAEKYGAVKYDKAMRTVVISGQYQDIQRAFLVHVSTDIKTNETS